MPRIQNIPGPYRFYFYSFDCGEPMHVHVQREKKTCKFWLAPIQLASNHDFSPKELNAIRRLIEDHYEAIVQAWKAHCGER